MAVVTLADVARRAGVSTTSASRALTGSRPVTDSVRAAVRTAAGELGYTGNSVARALRSQRTHTIGMVVPSILNPFFTVLVDAMERTLHDHDHALLLCDSRNDTALEARHLASLVDRHVDGIVISPCDEEHSVAALERAAGHVPVLQLDRRSDLPGLDWVGVDDDVALGLVLRHLRETGVGSAGLVAATLTTSSARDRESAFHRHARELGIDVRPEWIVRGEFSMPSGRAAGQRVFAAAPADRPQALVCADDLLAFGVLRAAREMGVRVPTDVRVTGFDDLDFAEQVDPPLTSVRQPVERMAQEAFRLLQARRDGSGVGTRIALAPSLVIRASTH